MEIQKLSQLTALEAGLVIPEYEFWLASIRIKSILETYNLSKNDIVNGIFSIRSEVLEKLNENIIDEHQIQSFQNLLGDLIDWPKRNDWDAFVKNVNLFLKNWLNVYKNGATISLGIHVSEALTLHSSLLRIPSNNFRMFMQFIIAETTSHYDQYRYNYLKNHDARTGLPNARLLLTQLDKLLKEKTVGLLIISFKLSTHSFISNQSLDADLINNIIQLIKENIKNEHVLFQLRLAEFGILIKNLEDSVSINLLAVKLLRAFEVTLHINRKAYSVTPTIAGILNNQEESISKEAFYFQAQITLNSALNSGVHLLMYSDSIKQQVDDQIDFEQELFKAFENNLFELYLQPIVNIPENICVSAEALLRWRREDGSFANPQKIVDIIYKEGFGKHFVRWLLNTACRLIREIAEILGYSISLTVNLTVDDLLDTELPHLLAQALRLWNIDARNITIEITESGFLIDEVLANQILMELKAMGCVLALDDFGTGYSSMSRLQTMPVQLVKIDQSFVRNILKSEEDRAIVYSISSLAFGLNKLTVAEGVEDEATLRIIQGMHCSKVQGYYFSKPLNLSDFVIWVKAFNTSNDS